MSHNSETLEFSRMVNVTDIPPSGHGFAVKATSDECAAICTRFDLVEVKRFEVSGTLKPQGKQRFILDAKFKVKIAQSCVITLDTIETIIEEVFQLTLMAGDSSAQDNVDETDQFDPYGEDPPLLFGVEKIDFGECTVQYFSGCLESYPRKSDATFQQAASRSEEKHKEKHDNPFDILQKLKQ